MSQRGPKNVSMQIDALCACWPLLYYYRYGGLNMLNSKHQIELGLSDSVSFSAVYGTNKVFCSFFTLIFM